MNTEHLRRSLKMQWLGYYRENRNWLTRLGVWVNCEGQRRPSSSFILGTLSALEPQLTQILPLVVDLSSNPDRIVMALGLNFNPDEELEKIHSMEQAAAEERKMLPASDRSRFPDRQTQVLTQPFDQPFSEPDVPSVASSAHPTIDSSSTPPTPAILRSSAPPSPSGNDRSSHRRPAMNTGELAPGQLPRTDESN